MKFNTLKTIGILALATVGTAANAVEVRIELNGEVDYNVIQGGMAGIPSGTPVTMSFLVDSNVFTNSASFPVRGYNIDLASMTLSVGSTSIGINNPQSGTAFFVLRNDDPAVDGIFLSLNDVDWPAPLEATIPGLTPVHELNAEVGFNNSTMWPTLDILDAQGTYDTSNLSSYYWALGRFGNPGAEFMFQSMTIQAVPEPATLFGLGLGALAIARKRRHARK